MALFNKWDTEKQCDGEPISLTHDKVENIETMIKTDRAGKLRHCCRVRLKSGKTVIVACPEAEVQDRLNDDIASAPEMPGVVTDAVGEPEQPAGAWQHGPDEKDDDPEFNYDDD